LAKGIKSGDRQYIGVVADILNVNKAEENLNRGKFDPTDFRFTGVDPEALKQGRLIATGQYSDGRQGVFTAQGGSEPNENVINTSVDEGVDLAIEALQMRVIPNSNMGATSAESRLNVEETLAELLPTRLATCLRCTRVEAAHVQCLMP